MKKKNTGLIVTIVILIVLLLGLAGYTAYDKLVIQKDNEEELTKVNDELKSANEKIAELEKAEEEEIISTDNPNHILGVSTDINIYAIEYTYMLYSYKGTMYVAIDGGIDHNHLKLLLSDEPTKSTKNCDVTKLNVNEKDVYKIMITDDFYAKDAQLFAYIIYKDGSVKRYNIGPNIEEEGELVLKDYKVKDLKVKCGKSNEYSCEELSYELTLQDGTTKTVTEK